MSVPPPAAAEAFVLDASAFAARMHRFEPFEPHPRIAVALSGGPDSMACLDLAREWASARGGSVRAFIVDHRLREGSALEARRVWGWASELGVEAEILTVPGTPPGSAVQEWARRVRYRALGEACRRHGIFHLLLAHHREDLAETVQLRRLRGSGPRGLAGMPCERFLTDLRLLRPLLDVPREALRTHLMRRRLPWIEDPSNRDPRYARARLRLKGALPVERLIRIAGRAARLRAARDRQCNAFLACSAHPWPLGLVTFDQRAWAAARPALRRLVLARCLGFVSGRIHGPRITALHRLEGRLCGERRLRTTLGGCLVEADGEKVRVLRERRHLPPPRLLAPGEETWWDRRWWIRFERGPCPLRLQPLSASPTPPAGARIALLAGDLRAFRYALGATPALFLGSRPVASPLRRGAAEWRISFEYRPEPRLTEAPFRGILV